MSNNNLREAPYHELDHEHCWQSRKPPCGQSIEHLKCCLCEKLNPKIESKLKEDRKEIIKRIENIKKEIQEKEGENTNMWSDIGKVSYYYINKVLQILNNKE